MTSLRYFQQPKRQHQQRVTSVRMSLLRILTAVTSASCSPCNTVGSVAPFCMMCVFIHGLWEMLCISPRLRFQLGATPIELPDNAVAERYYPKHCSSRFKMLGGREFLEKRPRNIPAVPINWLLYVLQNALGNFEFFLYHSYWTSHIFCYSAGLYTCPAVLHLHSAIILQ